MDHPHSYNSSCILNNYPSVLYKLLRTILQNPAIYPLHRYIDVWGGDSKSNGAVFQICFQRNGVGIVLILSQSRSLDIEGVNKAHRRKKREELILHNVFRWGFYCVPYIQWKRGTAPYLLPEQPANKPAVIVCRSSLTLL